MAKGKHQDKGAFGDARLPVAPGYVKLARRQRTFLFGLLAGATVAALGLYGVLGGKPGFMQKGRLSSNHGNLEQCNACHDPMESATDAKCAGCHERFGERLGTYSFASHYLYRSTDAERAGDSNKEMPCRTCHSEHQGRDFDITVVGNAKCVTCHDFDPFGRKHPEFDVAAEPFGGSGAIKFPHVHHVRELINTRGVEGVEQACLACHKPDQRGLGFESINFDAHCSTCHLLAATATPRLPVATGAGLGVETLEAMRRRGGLGTGWTATASDTAFRVLPGERVMKVPVTHRDPWVMENLRRLRRSLYTGTEMADLLDASADPVAGDAAAPYSEALTTLRLWADELASSPDPEMRDQLLHVHYHLSRLEQRLKDPSTELTPGRFDLGPARAASATDIEMLVADLTEPCRHCHVLDRATFTRVPEDLQVLTRTKFNHQAHILQLGCLDCHDKIPLRELVPGSEEVATELDRAEIQNLPAIDSCRQCHTATQASDRCMNCHDFHPNKDHRTELAMETVPF